MDEDLGEEGEVYQPGSNHNDEEFRGPKILAIRTKMVYFGLCDAEVGRFLRLECSEDGYGGVEIRRGLRTEIIIRASRTRNILGERGKRIRELQSAITKRFGQDVEVYVETTRNRGLCPVSQAESLKFKIMHGLAMDRAVNGVIRFIMENGALGVEIILSGKIKGQRAKAKRYKEGYLTYSGDDTKIHIVKARTALCLRMGVLGIKVSIHLPLDGKRIRKDVVKVFEPPAPVNLPLTFSYTGFKPLPPNWQPEKTQPEKKKKKKKKTTEQDNPEQKKTKTQKKPTAQKKLRAQPPQPTQTRPVRNQRPPTSRLIPN